MSGRHYPHFGHTTRPGHLRTEPGDAGVPTCPACAEPLEIGTDGDGRTVQRCRCGSRYVPRKPAPEAGGTALVADVCTGERGTA